MVKLNKYEYKYRLFSLKCDLAIDKKNTCALKSVAGESHFTGTHDWTLVIGAGRIWAAATVVSLTLVDIWNIRFRMQ